MFHSLILFFIVLYVSTNLLMNVYEGPLILQRWEARWYMQAPRTGSRESWMVFRWSCKPLIQLRWASMLLEAGLIECEVPAMPWRYLQLSPFDVHRLWNLELALILWEWLAFLHLKNIVNCYHLVVLLGRYFFVWVYTLMICWIMGVHIHFSCCFLELYIVFQMRLFFCLPNIELIPWLFSHEAKVYFTNLYGWFCVTCIKSWPGPMGVEIFSDERWG